MDTEIKYLTQQFLPNIGAFDVVQEEGVAAGLKEFNNINFISGYEARFISALEKKRKLHTIGCFLHQNELSFTPVFKFIDGTTRNLTTFIGPLGNLRK